MLGSSASISDTNTVLNTAVAEALRQFADELETATDFETTLHDLIKRIVSKHKRIIFNGNGYDDAWTKEAEKRGLLNLKTTPDALPHFIAKKNVELFTSHKVYTEKEMYSRYEILLESYCKLISIEARTMVDMAKQEILPAVSEYSKLLADTALSKTAVCKNLDCAYEKETLSEISKLQAEAFVSVKALEKALADSKTIDNVTELSQHCKNNVLSAMRALREAVDGLEGIVSVDYWPFPTYGDLLFGV